MADGGELRTYPDHTTAVTDFLRDLAEHLQSERVIVAGADRYRKAEIQDKLVDAELRWLMAY